MKLGASDYVVKHGKYLGAYRRSSAKRSAEASCNGLRRGKTASASTTRRLLNGWANHSLRERPAPRVSG
jgi:hypothetical protein